MSTDTTTTPAEAAVDPDKTFDFVEERRTLVYSLGYRGEPSPSQMDVILADARERGAPENAAISTRFHPPFTAGEEGPARLTRLTHAHVAWHALLEGEYSKWIPDRF
jgi:hypothetical protein